MNDEDLIPVLEKCIENDSGDLGRTRYLIKRIKKKQLIFHSDRIYLERLVNFEQAEISDIDIELEKPIQTKLQTGFINFIKCNSCSNDIVFNEKAIRKNNVWFHEKCYESTNYIKPTFGKIQEPQPRRIQEPQPRIQEPQPRRTRYDTIPKKIIINKTTKPQTIFTASLLASLVVSVYYLLGEIAATIVGVSGTSIFIVTYKSQFQVFKKEKKYVGIKTSENLIKTGIPGFESYLSNGLKINSSIVVSGSPGTGKTTFGLQFLYSGAKDFDEPGVYITMSQNIEDIKNDCKSFGWDFDDLIQKDKILMIDARPFKIHNETIGKDDSLYRGEQLPFEHLTKLLINSIKRIDAKRVVIDSVTILAMQYQDKFYMRQGLQGMIQALENYGVTSLIISEFSESPEIPLEWFVTSGIIQLRHTRTEDTMERSIQITKMRGIKHSEQIHPIVLGNDGLYIFDVSE